MTALVFLLGAVSLILGAELLVRGAARLAVSVGLTPLVIGLTVVAFGTSAPELAVTTGAAWSGRAGMAVGNVVGSNIFNVLFILGVSALIAPLAVARDLVRLDVPVMIVTSVAVLLLALDGRIGRLDGALLLLTGVVYTRFLLVRGRRPAATREDRASRRTRQAAENLPDREAGLSTPLVLVGIGLVLLVVGARWLIRSAATLAVALGVSELVVGLTIVAVGTSLPEVATSIMAAIRGQRDIAVGNVVGSNIFNLLAVLGLGSTLAPGGIPVSPGVVSFDLPVMTGVALALLPIVFTGYVIARWEGLVFLGYYAAYAAFLGFDATGHQAADELGDAMVYFVIPLTAITLAVLAIRALPRPARTRDGPPEDRPGGPS